MGVSHPLGGIDKTKQAVPRQRRRLTQLEAKGDQAGTGTTGTPLPAAPSQALAG